MRRLEGQPKETELEKRQKVRQPLIEPRVYELENPLNQQALETVSQLRRTLEKQSGSVTFSLFFDEPPYFKTATIPSAWGFNSKISYVEHEGSEVSVNQEEVELHYWIEDEERRQSFVKAMESGLGSVCFKLNVDRPMRIWIQPYTGGITIDKVEILGWEEKGEKNNHRLSTATPIDELGEVREREARLGIVDRIEELLNKEQVVTWQGEELSAWPTDVLENLERLLLSLDQS